MIPVPKKIEIVYVHDTSKYHSAYDNASDETILMLPHTSCHVVVDDVFVVKYVNAPSFGADAVNDAYCFIRGMNHAFEHYFTVLDFPPTIERHEIVR